MNSRQFYDKPAESWVGSNDSKGRIEGYGLQGKNRMF